MKNNAIETEYKGYRFRSRTEARWAVFFDTLGIRWEYELQGYRVGVRQVKYLPDFYMPEWDKFVEIKALKNIELSEVEKAGLLVQYEGKPVLMLLGQPWPGEYATRLIIPCNDPATKAPYTAVFIPPDKTRQFGFAPHSNRVYIHYPEMNPPYICLNLDLVVDSKHLLMLMTEDNISYLKDDMEKGIYSIEGPMSTTRDLLQVDTILHRAYIAARQARFEFRETGKSIDDALRLHNPLMEGLSPYFDSEVLARVRAIENDALKGKESDYTYQRPYVFGECVAAWPQPGAMVSVTRLARGIRAREYMNILKPSHGTQLMVIDIKTENLFNSYKQRVGKTLDKLLVVRIEYDNSFHIMALTKDSK